MDGSFVDTLPDPTLRAEDLTAPRAAVAVERDNAAGAADLPDIAQWGDDIAEDRQAELDALQRAWETEPAGRAGPFAGVRLSGADVFWLATRALAGRAPDPSKAAERLRMARQDSVLRQALDLSALHLTGADLQGAELEGAGLRAAHVEGANLWGANLRRACLQGAHLDRADLTQADLRVANLTGASLRDAELARADLGGAVMSGAHLRGARLRHAILVLAHLEGARFRGAFLAGANLAEAHLQGAFLGESVLEGANLRAAHLEGANLTRATLQGANLREASLDRTTRLNQASLDRVALAHVDYGGADLTTMYWSEVRRLGDEVEARRARSMDVVYDEGGWRVERTDTPKRAWQRRNEFTDAARAYRALAHELRAQGLAREARRFHYRAELMERFALLYEMPVRLLSPDFFTVPFVFGRWLLSWLLDTFAGYGDYIGRLVGTYLLVVLGCAALFLLQSGASPTWPHYFEAVALSASAFHGHGLAAPDLRMSQPAIWLAGVESFAGLVLEALFVAAITRRLISG
jgi:uncharacterized protein YjbI with pentapeptide repeats